MKPCPFCGSLMVALTNDLSTYYVECEHCGALGPSSEFEDDAIMYWDIGVAYDRQKLFKEDF